MNYKSTKRLHRVLYIFSAIFFLFVSVNANACDINLKVVDKKDKIKVGDEIVVKVTVGFTHRNCPVNIDDTKFKLDGLKVLGQTKWESKSGNKYERKLKVKVTKSGNISVSASRTCDKEGGFGSLKLKAD